MRILIGLLLLAAIALAQNPPAGAIQIGQTNINGGVANDCLTVSSAKKLGQVVCGGAPSGAAGGNLTGTYPNPGVKGVRSGLIAALPATCTVGDIYFATDATAGANIYQCTATNTWSAPGGGASPAGSAGQYQFKVDPTTFGAGANTTNSLGVINIGGGTDAGTRGIIRLVPTFGDAVSGLPANAAIHATTFFTGDQTPASQGIGSSVDFDVQLNTGAKADIAAAVVGYAENDEDVLTTTWLTDFYAEADYADNTNTTNQAGVLIQSMRAFGSSAVNSYGIYINDQGNGSTDYAIYAAGATSKSKLEGTLQTGGYLSSDASVGTTGNGFKNGLCTTASGACTGALPTSAFFTNSTLIGTPNTVAATPALVESPTAGVGNVTSQAVSFSTPPTQGELIVVGVASNQVNNITVTDNQGNSYVAVTASNQASANLTAVSVFYALAGPVSGTFTITATSSFNTNQTAAGFLTVMAGHYTGSTGVVDTFATSSGSGTAQSTANLTTTGANDLILMFSVGGATSFTAGSGYTVIANSSNGAGQNGGSEYRIASTAGSYAVSMTSGGSTAWRTMSVAFLSGTPGTTITNSFAQPTGSGSPVHQTNSKLINAKLTGTTVIDSFSPSDVSENIGSSGGPNYAIAYLGSQIQLQANPAGGQATGVLTAANQHLLIKTEGWQGTVYEPGFDMLGTNGGISGAIFAATGGGFNSVASPSTSGFALMDVSSGTASTVFDSFRGVSANLTSCSGAALASGSSDFVGTITGAPSGTCTVILTFTVQASPLTGSSGTAAHGWICPAGNMTTVGNVWTQTASSATTATFSGVTVSGDTLRYGPCGGY